MSHNADQDLTSQQHHLSSTSYDLRITNLARFIYRLISNCHPEQSEGSRKYMDSSPAERGQNDKKPTFFDVGAGNGLFLKFFKEKGFNVSGIELEKELVANMKKDPDLKGVNISQGDITKITNPRGSQQYDVVLASDVIEHIEDDKRAIQNLWSHVAPGGLMVITVPAHSHLYGKRDKMWGHYRRYDAKVLIDRINEVINTTPSPDKSEETPPYKGGELKKNKGLLLNKEEYPESSQTRRTGEVVFVTFWNIVGYFIYFLYEKILHKPINENMRYSNSLVSRTMRTILDKILRLEEMIGGLPLGLTLVVGVRKKAGDISQ
ncbi:MAG: class I SAM-dependent methyltransferase [bacterium]|nr:class I SAM-dependent methyltransferase [bacterium]